MDKNDKEVEKVVIKETSESFSTRVEELVWKEDISYYEAVTQLMAESEYEPEIVSKLITPTLKSRLALELEDINLIKKSGKGRLF
jgi:CRISPR/Cas system type I-B associated protein Csh2 (Cas7 group RAMP superfamily)